MFIRITKNQVLNCDAAERFTFAYVLMNEGEEALWYFAIHWKGENSTILALRDQSAAAGEAVICFLMECLDSGKKGCDLTPYLLNRKEEASLIRELQRAKRRIRSGDVVEAELVN